MSLKKISGVIATGWLACLSSLGFSKIPENGLIAWLDASDASTIELDGTSINAWKSKVGQHDLQFQSNGSQRPQYIKDRAGDIRPRVVFDGRNDVLKAVNPGMATESWTLFMTVAPQSGRDMGGLISACPENGNDYEPGFNVDLYNSGAAFEAVNVEGAGRLSGQSDLMESNYPYGGFHVVVVRRDKDRVELSIDGKVEGTRPMATTATRMDIIRLGARHYDMTERHYFTGGISQVLLYDRSLSDADVKELTLQYQISKAERESGDAGKMAVSTENTTTGPRMATPRKLESWPTIAAWQASSHAQVPVDGELARIEGLPIRTDLREAIELCVMHLNSLFDADRDGEPFFYSNCQSDGTGKMYHSVNIGIPHVVGRCLLGSLISEDLAGVIPPPEGIAILERYCKSSFDNPDHLNSYFDPARENKRFVEMHNMREGLYGLVFLYKMRNSEWAHEKIELMLGTLASITDEKGAWSLDLAKKTGLLERLEGASIMNAARIIDPLLEYYRMTGSAEALRLAGLYARQGMLTGFTSEGLFTPMAQSSAHVHSITSSLSGMADYASLKHDKAMFDMCEKIMRNGVPEYFSSWGWGDEVFPEHPANVVLRGEINQTGDVIRTALILGEFVSPDYYDLAERYVRSMVLPTQHREKELRRFLKDKPDPKDDSEANVIRRSIGGFAMQSPNDRMQEGDWPISTLDITSGAAHSLSECVRHLLRKTSETTRLNLMFSGENEQFEVRSHLPLEGRVEFISKGGRSLSIRVPAWVDRSTLRLVVNREAVEVKVEKNYVVISDLEAGHQGELSFDVPCRMEREIVDGTEFTTKWVGDQIVQIEPRGRVSPLPF